MSLFSKLKKGLKKNISKIGAVAGGALGSLIGMPALGATVGGALGKAVGGSSKKQLNQAVKDGVNAVKDNPESYQNADSNLQNLQNLSSGGGFLQRNFKILAVGLAGLISFSFLRKRR